MLFNSGISRFKKEVLRVLGKEKSKILRDRLEYLSYFLYPHATPIAVYQMGKVGSQSVYLSLKEVGYFPLFHFHYMDHLREQKPYHYSYLQRVLKHGQRLKIIALVREPVGRNLSAFAHDFHGYFGSRMQDHSLNELHNLFWQYDRHLNGINWFDTQ